MSIRARREQEKEHMRDIILKSAVKIIIAEGYDKLSIRKIADSIDYSPTTIYIYYKDKAQIVDDILKRIYFKIVSDVKKVLDENKDIPVNKQLELTCKEFIYSMTENPEMGKAITRSGTNMIFGEPDESVTLEENGVAMLQSLLLKGYQQSVLRKLDDNVSWMLITSLLGFSIYAIENQLYLNANWPELINIYTKILINGLLPIKEDK